MIINREFIDKSLKFYDISDNEYKNKIYECMNYIKNNNELENRIKNLHKILYNNKNNIRDIWKIKNNEELFGTNYHPFITNFLLLIGSSIHKVNMEKYDLDKKQINIHKKRVKECLINDIAYKKLPGIRISQMLWGIYFINIQLIEVGRLQYEVIDFNPLDESKKEKCIKIHIPKDDKLNIIDVKESLDKSNVKIQKYFELTNPNYYCTSWLLSNQIKNVVKENSNISKFYNLFDVIEGENCVGDILKYVFNVFECKDYNVLEEKTSLQKELKKLLLNNSDIKIGIGILKKVD